MKTRSNAISPRKEGAIEQSCRSVAESEVDGLIKWARELPEDTPL